MPSSEFLAEKNFGTHPTLVHEKLADVFNCKFWWTSECNFMAGSQQRQTADAIQEISRINLAKRNGNYGA